MPIFCDFSRPDDRQAWIQRLLGPLDEATWDAMVRDLFAWQHARVPAFARLCAGRGVSPETLRSWKDIPAIPQALFKRDALYCAGLPEPAAIYETSGTTTGQPGRQHLASTDIYRAVSTEGARRTGLFVIAQYLHFLTPSPLDAPHSSLSAMFGFWHEHHGLDRGKFWVHENAIDFTKLRDTLTVQAAAGLPIGIAGTAFHFVHLLDAWAEQPRLKLPRGSWLLETGGFKGRSREIAKPELYAQLARTLGLHDVDIHNEYGMSELSSQAYTHGLAHVHDLPPWARVLVVDPATGREVRVGQKGLVRWIDLANTDSVLALQTLDVAERTKRGFHLIGRLPRTEPRGCSLGAEDMPLPGGSDSVPTLTSSVFDSAENVSRIRTSRKNQGRDGVRPSRKI